METGILAVGLEFRLPHHYLCVALIPTSALMADNRSSAVATVAVHLKIYLPFRPGRMVAKPSKIYIPCAAENNRTAPGGVCVLENSADENSGAKQTVELFPPVKE